MRTPQAIGAALLAQQERAIFGTNTETPMHPSVEHVMQFFKYDHLPEVLQAVSKPFSDLALFVASELPSNPETTVALRKLLEAKDCAVRAHLAG